MASWCTVTKQDKMVFSSLVTQDGKHECLHRWVKIEGKGSPMASRLPLLSARPMVSYVPNQRTSPLPCWHQIILLCDRGTCVGKLASDISHPITL